jgi:hypothetical protein
VGVRERVLEVGEAVDALSSDVAALASSEEPPDLEEVVLALRDLHAVLAQARDARDALAAEGAALMPQRQMVVAGLPVERTGGWDRSRWQHSDLLAHVVRWAREDRMKHAQEHDGELPPESEGQAVVALLQRYAGLGYWKVGATRDERGLDVDEYCERKPAKPGIKMPRSL